MKSRFFVWIPMELFKKFAEIENINGLHCYLLNRLCLLKPKFYIPSHILYSFTPSQPAAEKLTFSFVRYVFIFLFSVLFHTCCLLFPVFSKTRIVKGHLFWTGLEEWEEIQASLESQYSVCYIFKQR